MRLLSAVAAVLLLVGHGAGQSKSARAELTEVWGAREARYLGQRSGLEQAAKAAGTQADTTLAANEADFTNRVVALMDAVRDYGAIMGRGAMLREARILMASKPSPARVELWAQERADALKADLAAASAEASRVTHGIKEDSRPLQTWQAATYRMAYTSGSVSEFLLISRNLDTYFRAREDERQRSQAISNALAEGLANVSRNYNEASRRQWGMSCRTFGTRTDCSGN